MRVNELIDILRDQPPDAEVELAVVSPLTDDESVTVDRYPIDGVFPWQGDIPDDEGVWLIGGAPDDVDALLDSLEQDEPEGPGAD
ncbi:MAG: hypothetical protein ACPHO9_06925 [Ilumatobacteraceae bacterium]